MLTILANAIEELPDSRELLAGHHLSLPAQVDGKVGRLLVSVQGFEEVPPVQKARRTRKLAPQQLERAYAAMRELHAEPVRLSAIASLIGLSPWQFSRSFHETAGVTFSYYLMQLRTDAAMRLMLETDKSLCDIALASGFGDQSNFSRLFLRSRGITPMKWRHLNRESRNPSQSARHGIRVRLRSDEERLAIAGRLHARRQRADEPDGACVRSA